MTGQRPAAPSRRGRSRSRWLLGFHGIALAAAGVVALNAGYERWRWGLLALLAAIAVVSDLLSVETGSSRMKVNGCHLAIVLAAVILGGGPAAVVGVLTIAVGWMRWREAGHYLRNNLVVFAWFPLAAGELFHQMAAWAHVGAHDPGYYLLVFVTFIAALWMNFLGVAAYECFLNGTSLVRKTRETFIALLAADLFSGLLTLGAVYVTVALGVVGLGLCGVAMLVFQHLIGELLRSKRRGEDLHRMASSDDLTGLANRKAFHTHLERLIATSAEDERPLAVLLIDLDHFKEVNDSLGHHYGDVLLQALGPRLAAHAADGGLVARLGGDEFALLPAERTDDPLRLETLARDVLASLSQPLPIDDISLEVGASIGIARWPRDGEDAHTLLRRADVAMYAAKRSQSSYVVYEPDLDRESSRRLTVLSEFRRALVNEELVVHYQPVLDLQNRHVRGAEGLVRWDHPERGLLAPGAFVAAVEGTNLIGAMTRYVLERAIAQCAEWRAGGELLTVAVNLSVRNLLDPALPREVERLLSQYHLPPQALTLEITESMLMADPERSLRTVAALSDLGVSISVDDFGTGYSSLSNLRQLPIDELKLDRSFVTPMLNDPSDLIIVRSTINLAHDLGLGIIAEGVEDEHTLKRLHELGCDLVQGYHLSRPLDPKAFVDWLRAREAPARTWGRQLAA